jgi:hypothetical protein
MIAGKGFEGVVQEKARREVSLAFVPGDTRFTISRKCHVLIRCQSSHGNDTRS